MQTAKLLLAILLLVAALPALPWFGHWPWRLAGLAAYCGLVVWLGAFLFRREEVPVTVGELVGYGFVLGLSALAPAFYYGGGYGAPRLPGYEIVMHVSSAFVLSTLVWSVAQLKIPRGDGLFLGCVAIPFQLALACIGWLVSVMAVSVTWL